jgi:hypothetical protein
MKNQIQGVKAICSKRGYEKAKKIENISKNIATINITSIL